MRHCRKADVVVANEPTPRVSKKLATKLVTQMLSGDAIRSPAAARCAEGVDDDRDEADRDESKGDEQRVARGGRTGKGRSLH